MTVPEKGTAPCAPGSRRLPYDLSKGDGLSMSVPAVTVERVPVPEWANDLILRRPDQVDLLILPQRVRDGLGEYGMDDLVGVKTLRAAGVRADWAHSEPEDRTVASEYSADVAVSVVLFVGQSLAQEGVVEAARWLLARVRQALAGRPDRKTSAPVVVQVNRLTLEGDRREIEGLRVTGHDEQVVGVVTALLQGG